MAERDEWGRIPAILIENDQDFCAQEWSEGKCQAGPENNYQIRSRKPGNGSGFWSTNGTSESDVLGAVNAPEDRIYNPVFVLNLPSDGFLTVPAAQRAFLPVFNATDPLTYSIYTYLFQGVWRFSLGLTTDGGQTVQALGLSVDFSDLSSSNIDSGVSNYSADDSGQWTRITFDVDPSVVIASGVAYSSFVKVDAVSGADPQQWLSQPQISLGGVQRFKATDGAPKITDPQPCFNTVSSCQNLENYTVQGQNDGIAGITLV